MIKRMGICSQHYVTYIDLFDGPKAKWLAQFVMDVLGEIVVLGTRVNPSEEFIRFDFTDSSCVTEESVSKVERGKEGICMCSKHAEFIGILFLRGNNSVLSYMESLWCIMRK